MSSASCAAGDGWTGRPRPGEADAAAREPGAARVSGRGRYGGRPWAADARGRRPAAAGRSTPPARRCTSGAAATARQRRTRRRTPPTGPSSRPTRWPCWPRRRCITGSIPALPGERYQVVVHVDAAVLADPEQPGQSVLEDGRARFRGNVAAPGLRREPGGHAPRRGRARAGGRSPDPDDSAGASAGAAPSGPELSLPGLPACGSGRAITCATGPRAAPPRCRTSRCCAAAITARSTKRATRSIASTRRRAPVPTAGWPAATRGAAACRSARAIRCERCGRGTPRGDFGSTRARRARAGWASAWTSAGRSTCCILEPSGPRRASQRLTFERRPPGTRP